MMQIVIEIPKEVNEIILNTSFIVDFEIMMKQTAKEREQTNAIFSLIDAIRNGTPLPEHHGRLIEDDKISLRDICFATELDHAKMIGRLNSAPTIIPATKEGDGE